DQIRGPEGSLDTNQVLNTLYNTLTNAPPPSPSPAPASTTQFSDTGFSTPNVGTNAFRAFAYNPSGSAWTYSNSSGVAGNKSGFTGGNPNAPQGTQVAFLQEYGTISQRVNFSAGTYTLSFYAAQRAGQASSQTFEVLVDGTVVGTFTPNDTSYRLYS